MKIHAFTFLFLSFLLSSHQFILLVSCNNDSTQNDKHLINNNHRQNVRRRIKRDSGNFLPLIIILEVPDGKTNYFRGTLTVLSVICYNKRFFSLLTPYTPAGSSLACVKYFLIFRVGGSLRKM